MIGVDLVDRPRVAYASAIMLTYPPSLRQDVREWLRAEREQVRAAIVDLHDARERMFAVMRADPLDKEPFSVPWLMSGSRP